MTKLHIGARFGRLTIEAIIAPPRKDRSWSKFVLAVCDCGGRYEGMAYGVRGVRSCGCLRSEACREVAKLGRAKRTANALGKAAEMIGQKFGRLSVVMASSIEPGMITARCDCGTVWQGPASPVRLGRLQSCGCLASEQTIARSTKHGKHKWPEYEAWRGAIRRCTKPNFRGWRYYGGRGIRVCDRWMHGEGGMSGLECFIADMGPRPSPKHSIERRDNDGHYEPGNCIWATRDVQASNQRHAGRFGDPDRVLQDSARVAQLAALPPEKLAEFAAVRSGK